MAEFTLLKLQFEDASFTAHAPFSGAGEESEDGNGGEGAGETETDEDGDGGRSLLPLIAGLAVLVVAAVVVKKLRGGEGDR